MKKLIVASLLAVVLAVLAFALLLQRKLVRTDVPALLPAETIALAHLPDVRRTRVRWAETALAKMSREPEIVAFLERPKSQIGWLGAVQAQADRVLKVDPREAFAAVTAVEGGTAGPKVVGGFSFSGKREDVEALLADVRAQVQTAFPAGKSDLAQHAGVEIETFSVNRANFAAAFTKDWLFVANDVELLKSTLDRFSAGKRDESLRTAKSFSSTVSRMPREFDGLVFLQPKAVTERLASMLQMTGQQPNPGIENLRKIEAVVATTKLDGERIRDTVFTAMPNEAKLAALTRDSLALTSTDTLLYYATVMSFSAQDFALPDPALDQTGLLRQLDALRQALEAQGITLADFTAAFAEEASLSLDWPGSAMQPSAFLSVGVRDRARAQKIVEAFTGGAMGAAWGRRTEGGVEFYSAPPMGMMGLITPTMALTEKFLVLSLSPEAAQTAATRLKQNDAPVSSTAEFSKASELVNKPGAAFGYVDARRLFERVYGTARPFVAMSAAFAPQLAAHIDVNRLPATETVSKHLGPLVFSQTMTAEGTLTESVGPVTFGQVGLAVATGVGVAAWKSFADRAELLANPPAGPADAAASSTPEPAASPTPLDLGIPGTGVPTPSPLSGP